MSSTELTNILQRSCIVSWDYQLPMGINALTYIYVHPDFKLSTFHLLSTGINSATKQTNSQTSRAHLCVHEYQFRQVSWQGGECAQSLPTHQCRSPSTPFKSTRCLRQQGACGKQASWFYKPRYFAKQSLTISLQLFCQG